MSPVTSLEFVFDFISPYAYVAWRRIHAVAAPRGLQVEPVPALFAAMLNTHGQKGPAEIPAKRAYAFKDAYRKARRAGVLPLVPPPSHPFNPLLALRVATAASALAPAARRALIDGLFTAAWGGGGGVETPEAVRAAVAAAGLDADALLAQAATPAVKDALRRATEAVIARGAFGVPTVFAGGELFWGVESLEHLEDFLDGRDAIEPELLARWAELPASARR